VADPKALSSGVATSLVSTVTGIGIGVVGVIVFTVGLILWFATKDGAARPAEAADRK